MKKKKAILPKTTASAGKKKNSRKASSGQPSSKGKTKKATRVLAAAPANNAVPVVDHPVFIERNVHYFSKTDGWIAEVPFKVFKAGKTDQLSFHRDGTLPGEIKARAFLYSTEMESYFWGIDYRATGNTVAEIAALAAKPDNDMQALLDVAVAGYQPA